MEERKDPQGPKLWWDSMTKRDWIELIRSSVIFLALVVGISILLDNRNAPIVRDTIENLENVLGTPQFRNIDELILQGGTYRDPLTLEPYTGSVYELFPDDPPRIKERSTLKDGVFHGPVERYWENGQLQSKFSFTDGSYQDGPYEGYFENGQLWSRDMMRDGKQEGPFEAYYEETGLVRYKGIYKDGERCGEWIWDGEPVTYDPC